MIVVYVVPNALGGQRWKSPGSLVPVCANAFTWKPAWKTSSLAAILFLVLVLRAPTDHGTNRVGQEAY